MLFSCKLIYSNVKSLNKGKLSFLFNVGKNRWTRIAGIDPEKPRIVNENVDMVMTQRHRQILLAWKYREQ